MPRPMSARSEDENEEALRVEELKALQRQYRFIELEKAAYTKEINDKLNKQAREIKQLELEQAELKANLNLAESKTNENKDKVNAAVLQDLASHQDVKEQEIDDEKLNVQELSKKIQEWEKKCQDLNKNRGGILMSQEHTIKTQRAAKVLENRLDQALKKFNQQLVTNKHLREDIDALRVERSKYDALCAKFEKELEQMRKEKAQIVEASTQAYEQRDDAEVKMTSLREKACKDKIHHDSETKELSRVLDHDRRLKSFMGVKTSERKEDAQQTEWKQRKALHEAAKKSETEQDTLGVYEHSFQRIKEIMQEDNLEIVVQKFIETEDENFALFNFVNDQNNQIEIINEQIQEVRHEIDKFEQQGLDLEEERRDIQKTLEAELSDKRQKADIIVERTRAVEKVLDQLRAAIQSIFDKIGCDRAAVKDMLQSETGVDFRNMLTFLGVIEQRTNALVAMQSFVQYKQTEYSKPQPAAPAAETTTKQAKVVDPLTMIAPPALGEDGQEDDDDARPFTRTELESKVLRNMRVREAQMATIKKDGTKVTDLGGPTQVSEKGKANDKRRK